MIVAIFCVALLGVPVFMLIRNERVARERLRILNYIREQNGRDITAGIWDRRWEDRYDEFDRISYNEMLVRFWKPVRSFYADSWLFHEEERSVSEVVKRIDPDAEIFIPIKGKAIKLPNGNHVELYACEKHDDWMIVFYNANRDRRTMLRLSPEALWAVYALASERVVDKTLKRPDFPEPESKEEKR
jgi:hypothetical protein